MSEMLPTSLVLCSVLAILLDSVLIDEVSASHIRDCIETPIDIYPGAVKKICTKDRSSIVYVSLRGLIVSAHRE